MSKDRRPGAAGFLAGTALSLALSLAVLAALIWFAGTNAGLMSRWMLESAPPQSTGLPAEIYAPLCTALTGYLKGAESVFDFTRGGLSLFGATEKIHLADCAQLFRLDRTVLILSAAAALLLSGLLLRKRWKGAWNGIVCGAVLSLAAAAALCVWGLSDFDSLFVAFHRAAFTNDLWLMNPATNLMVRLMPTGFFVRYALLIGGGWLLALALIILAGLRARRRAR